jgi:hypothetical protein
MKTDLICFTTQPAGESRAHFMVQLASAYENCALQKIV